MPKKQRTNNSSPRQDASPVLAKLRKRIAVQAALAVTTIILTVVMVFAMTAAWYTNVVHTNGLTFEVESWGFNGEIISNMLPIVAGPGDDGVIHLEVASDSDSPSAVSVSFSKVQMPSQMQKRIFFYVDTQTVRNDETLDRIYLSSQESYTYSLFSQGKLTLTETVHNDAQLKWHWVYDVLGYYVQGNLVTLSDGQNTKAVAVTEYLRPIEYDYDQATMAYVTDASGNTTMELKTVDGVRSPEEFLVDFSKTDGYTGEIDPTKMLETGYYPVDVDENGNGVYAYLCSYAEIQQNTAYDTALGQGTATGELPPYTAKLMVSAQKSKNTVVNVSSLSGLTSAIELGAGDVIQLTGDITLNDDQVLAITAGQEIMLDLNGHKLITGDPDTIPIRVEEGGSLTMINGTLAYDNELDIPSNTYAMQFTGAEVVLSNVDLSGYEMGMRIADNSGTQGKDSAVRMVGCDWTTSGCTMLVYGNGTSSAPMTQLVIENSNLTSESNFVISGNGNATHRGTDIQILNSTLISNPDYIYSAIYHPQKDGTLTIYNSTVTGYTGIAIKGGTVNIIGSTVEGKGAGMDEITKFANSGFNDTGDAVYIETNYGNPIELNISDLETRQSLLTSAHQYSYRIYQPDAAWVKVNITGGIFQDVADLASFVEQVDEGSEASVNDSGFYVVTRKPEEEQPDQTG